MKFDLARGILIEKVISNKKVLIGMMQDGSRDFEVQERLFDEYIDCQEAVDALATLSEKVNYER